MLIGKVLKSVYKDADGRLSRYIKLKAGIKPVAKWVVFLVLIIPLKDGIMAFKA